VEQCVFWNLFQYFFALQHAQLPELEVRGPRSAWYVTIMPSIKRSFAYYNHMFFPRFGAFLFFSTAPTATTRAETDDEDSDGDDAVPVQSAQPNARRKRKQPAPQGQQKRPRVQATGQGHAELDRIFGVATDEDRLRTLADAADISARYAWNYDTEEEWAKAREEAAELKRTYEEFMARKQSATSQTGVGVGCNRAEQTQSQARCVCVLLADCI
jgi:hypothetical protein